MRHSHPHADMFGLAARPDRYTRLTKGPFRRVHERVIADVLAAGLPDDARVLDIGTGPGGVPIAIAESSALHVDGLDLSAEMIAHARGVAESRGCERVTFTTADVAALPFPDASFDLIVSSMSQHHWADIPGGLREIRRVLRPGGQAWIYDARILLHRAKSAAMAESPAGTVRIDVVRTGRTLIPLIGRICLTAP